MAAPRRRAGLAGEAGNGLVTAPVRCVLYGRVSLDLGWRRLQLRFDESTNEGNMVFRGPFVEVGVEL